MNGLKGTSLVIQPRDLRLIEALETMRVINREQAKIVSGFRSTRRANDRLLKLTRAGILKRAFVGDHQAVYFLSNTELQKARKKGGIPDEPAALFLRHRLEINRVNLLVQYASIPARGWWFGCWRGFQSPLSETLPLIPDGYFEIGSAQGVRSVFVEIDLGTEATAVLAKKAGLYLQLAASGDFARIFGRTQFRVLLVTTSARRVENIRAAIAKLTEKIFWLGTLDLLSPQRFWNACWQRPTGEQLQSIL